MTKPEYIKQLKRLIKKFHPDVHSNEYAESTYNEITKVLVNKLNEIRAGKELDINAKSDVAANQDYQYYKQGIKYYRNIHPGKLYKRNPDTTFETKTYKVLLGVLNTIYVSFNLAEYYFKKVITEYPNSQYSEDAKNKIDLLKKLYKSYANIMNSGDKIVQSDKFMSEMGLRML